MVSCMAFCLMVVRTHIKNMKDLRGWWLEDRGEERAWVDLIGWDEKQRGHYEFGWEQELCLGVRATGHRSVQNRVITFNWVRWLLIFFYFPGNCCKKPWRLVSVTSLGSDTSLFRLLCCPLHCTGVTMCTTAWWTERVSGGKWAWGTGKREREVTSAAQLH